jgi:hypothetical protein
VEDKICDKEIYTTVNDRLRNLIPFLVYLQVSVYV